MLEWFLEDHVTLKTVVMTAKKNKQKQITFLNI